MPRHRSTRRLAGLGLLTVLALATAPFAGVYRIPFETLFVADSPSQAHEILWQLRMPRVVMAMLTGSALATSGMAFQAIFRNPLTTPFTLGVSSGASLGAAIYVQVGLAFSLLGIPGMSWFAFVGALGAAGLVFGLAAARRDFSSSTLLLTGVAMSYCFSSLVLFLHYVGDFVGSFRIIRWLMGGLAVVGWRPVLEVLPFFVLGTGSIVYLANELDLLSTGRELASARGVNVRRTIVILFLSISLMTGAFVAVCGPIGFVGLIVPHICRHLVGAGHRRQVVATILFGGTFLVLCDTVARHALAPTDLPVGVVTALLGGPFFLWLLLSRKRSEVAV